MFAFIRRPRIDIAQPKDWVDEVMARFEAPTSTVPAPSDDLDERDLDFGASLTRIAAAKGVTQSDLARRCRISTRRMGHYFNNDRRPSFELLLKMATVLNVDLYELLGVHQPGFRPPTHIGPRRGGRS